MLLYLQQIKYIGLDWFLIFSISIILFGYGFYALPLPRRKSKIPTEVNNWPKVSFIIPAFNEADFLAEKIENTLNADYPKDNLEIIVAADGTTDNSKDIVSALGIKYENNGARLGKGFAMNRAVGYAQNDILIFSDANAMLNKEAIKEIVKPLLLDQYAMSSGEKKVIKKSEKENASAGEGVYWKYESYLKKRDDDFYSSVAAVGELFGIKKSHFKQIPQHILLDDFYEAASVLLAGKKISYASNAIATEYGSLNFKEEIKRKVRISAGGYQSLFIFKKLFNPFFNWKITYLFVSHRVLRWTIIPALYFILPMYLIAKAAFNDNLFYNVAALLATIYFFASFLGLRRNIADKKAPFFLNIPFYISMMNYCALAGAVRFFSGIKTGAWEKAKRA